MMLNSLTGVTALRIATSKVFRRTVQPIVIRRFTTSRRHYQPVKESAATSTKKPKTAAKVTAKKAISPSSSAEKKRIVARTTKKTVAKKSTKPKAKKTAVKLKKPVRKVKKLSPEQMEKIKIKLLKKKALIADEPKYKPVNSWAVYMSEKIKNHDSTSVADAAGKCKEEWDRMSDSEKESYSNQAAANRKENSRRLKQWAESHAVEDVYLANLARLQLNRMKVRKAKLSKIPDSRRPSMPPTSFARFVILRAPDVQHLPKNERFGSLAQSWKELSDAEKGVFEQEFLRDKETFDREMKPMIEKAKEKSKILMKEGREMISVARRRSPESKAQA